MISSQIVLLMLNTALTVYRTKLPAESIAAKPLDHFQCNCLRSYHAEYTQMIDSTEIVDAPRTTISDAMSALLPVVQAVADGGCYHSDSDVPRATGGRNHEKW